MQDKMFYTLILLSSNFQAIWMLLKPYLLLLFSLVDIKIYRITNREKINYIRGNIKGDFCIYYDETGLPIGMIIHKNKKEFIPRYICWSPDCEDSRVLYIMSSKKTRERLLDNALKSSIITNGSRNQCDKEIELCDENNKVINYYSRCGNYSYFTYHSRTLYINQSFTKNQKNIANDIISHYNNHNCTVAYIYGNIGTGKTFMSYLISKEVNGSYCNTFQPTDPGDYFQDLYSIVKPRREKPLVLLLDEIDIILKNIHEQNIRRHKNYPVQIYNKMTWNGFLDKIGMGIYPNLILLLCSNKHINDIHAMDKSFLRNGRVNIIKELKCSKLD